jgi:LPS-assembly lipoprotein
MTNGRLIRLSAALVLTLALTGCGFKAVGQANMPFETLYVTAPDYSSFGAEFKRYVESYGKTRITDNPQQAQVILEILSETQEQQILSLTSAGRVAEFLLRYRVTYRLRDNEKRDWIPRGEIQLQRDYTYDDTIVLAKENEAQLLFKDMKNDAIQQLVRRLSAAQAPS